MTYLVGAQPTETVLAADLPRSGKQFGLGDRLTTADGKEFVWLQAGGTFTAAGTVVFFDTAYSATLLSTSNDAYGNLCAIVPGAMAAGDQGWFQVKGPAAEIFVKASCAATVRINTTATAGALDDDGTVGAMAVNGIALTSARAASDGMAPGILNYPQIGATL